MSTPELVLINCPPWGVETPPLSLAYLTTYLRKNGVRVEPIDLNIRLYNRFKASCSFLWDMNFRNYWDTPETFPQVEKLFEKEINSAVDEILHMESPTIGFSIHAPKHLMSYAVMRRIKERAPEKK